MLNFIVTFYGWCMCHTPKASYKHVLGRVIFLLIVSGVLCTFLRKSPDFLLFLRTVDLFFELEVYFLSLIGVFLFHKLAWLCLNFWDYRQFLLCCQLLLKAELKKFIGYSLICPYNAFSFVRTTMSFHCHDVILKYTFPNIFCKMRMFVFWQISRLYLIRWRIFFYCLKGCKTDHFRAPQVQKWPYGGWIMHFRYVHLSIWVYILLTQYSTDVSIKIFVIVHWNIIAKI